MGEAPKAPQGGCKFTARTTPALIHPAHGPTSLFLSLILQDCRLPRAESLPAHALAGTKGRMSSVKAVSSFLTFHRNLGEHTYSSFQNPKVQQHNLGVSSATSKGPLQRSPITLRHLECLSPRLHFFFSQIPAQSQPVPGHPTILSSLGSGQGDAQKRLGLAFWGTPNFHRTCSALIID